MGDWEVLPAPKRRRKKPAPRLSLHKVPIRLVHARMVLDYIGVLPTYQGQFITRSPIQGLGYTGYVVDIKRAAQWAFYYEMQWWRHIRRLIRRFEANGNWPPPSANALCVRLVLAGLLDEEVWCIMRMVFPPERVPKTESFVRQVRFYNKHRLPPELGGTKQRTTEKQK